MRRSSLGCDRRRGRLLHLVKFSSGVRPTTRKLDATAFAEPIEAGVPIDLHDATERRQMRGGTLSFAIGAIEIEGGRQVRSIPGPVIASIDPQSTRLGAPAAARA